MLESFQIAVALIEESHLGVLAPVGNIMASDANHKLARGLFFVRNIMAHLSSAIMGSGQR